jgi:hypothetical protein
MYLSHRDKNSLKAVLILLSSFVFIGVNAAEDGRKPFGTQPTVIVDSKTQAVAGLKTALVTPFEHHEEFEAIGKVISIQPLLALRERYLVAQAELNGAKAKQKQSGQSLKRQQALFRHGISAKRSVQEQEALGSGDQALVDASQVRLMTVANEARLNWGKDLADWILSVQANKLAAFLSGRQCLVQVTLPANKHLVSEVNTIFIEPSGQRIKAYSAALVSRSTQVDNAQQGESYFFQVSVNDLRLGMKVAAWIPESKLGQSGVVIPESALVWYMDQVYVYVKVGKDTFSRRLIGKVSTAPGGYFIQNEIKAGEEVVTTGGQILLSEELRGQIPDDLE